MYFACNTILSFLVSVVRLQSNTSSFPNARPAIDGTFLEFQKNGLGQLVANTYQ